MKVKLTSCVLAASLLAGMAAGCNGGSTVTTDGGSKQTQQGAAQSETTTRAGGDATTTSEGTKISYPIKDGGKISWYVQDGPVPHEKFKNASESPFHVHLAENLGLEIDWSFPSTGADAAAFTTTLFADPSALPNIMKIGSMENATQYIDDGVIWDLTPYIQEYAPDYYKFLQTNKAYDRAMKTDDGKYYRFGFFREDAGWNDTYLGPVVRTDWLKACNLDIPKTISEFENVMKVFKEKYGATFDANYSRYNFSGLAGAFGAYGNSLNNSTWGWYVKDGKVNLAQAQPEWREYVKWQNKMWKDGLIDQDLLTEDDTTIKAKIHNDKCGIAITSMGQMNNWNKERVAAGKEAIWAGIPYPTADDGSLSSVFGGPGIGDISTVITKTADENTLKICLMALNYAYTEEGNLYWNYGKQGESWDYDSKGIPTFSKLVTDDKDTDPMTKYNGSTWSGPCIQATNLLHLKNSEAAVKANDTWFYNVKDEAKNLEITAGYRWPSGATFTTEEADELDQIAGNLPTYVAESYASFLNGSKDISDDAVWNEYLKNLENYKLSRILELRQACYERYLKR